MKEASVNTHAAGADGGHDFVRAESCAWGQGQGLGDYRGGNKEPTRLVLGKRRSVYSTFWPDVGRGRPVSASTLRDGQIAKSLGKLVGNYCRYPLGTPPKLERRFLPTSPDCRFTIVSDVWTRISSRSTGRPHHEAARSD